MEQLLLIAVAGAIVGAAALGRSAGLRAARRATEDAASDSVRGAAQSLGDTIGRAENVRDDLSLLSTAVDLGVVRLDETLRVVTANATAHALFTRPDGGMQGRPLLEAIVDAAIEEHLRDEALASQQGDWRDFDLGRGQVRSVALRPAAGSGWWLLVRDASEITRLRRIRTEFVENLSHELRTPVTAIGLLSELLASDTAAEGSVPPKVRERILQIEADAVHLGQMISELLDLARIESGEGMHQEDLIDLNAIAHSAVDRLKPFAEQAHVQMEIFSSAPLQLSRRGNAARLTQVLVNLVHNAIKFSPQGGTVKLSISTSGGEAIVRVADQGAGIARADLERIFERFFVADKARSKGGGTGLGLAIARHIIGAHGGTIGATSQLGEGSTFTIALPLK